MEPAATTSPFATLSKQEQREKWHAWQSTHLEAQDIPENAEFPAPKLPPLRIPMQQAPQEDTRFIPRHNQYNQVLAKMKQASDNAQYVDI